MDFGRGSYGRPKLAQPSSFPAELGQESPTKEVSSASQSSSLLSSAKRAQLSTKRSTHAGELISNQKGQLMQESSALLKEVSSCRRTLHCPKKSSHAGELSTAQRGQLMQESSALTKEVSSALHKRPAHAGELSTP